jgi:hypothetical protein
MVSASIAAPRPDDQGPAPSPRGDLQAPWPDGKDFAFTVFDDTDGATVATVRDVYAFLRDCGLRTTKSVWPMRGPHTPVNGGDICAEPEYRAWVVKLQSLGFEIGSHITDALVERRPWRGLHGPAHSRFLVRPRLLTRLSPSPHTVPKLSFHAGV